MRNWRVLTAIAAVVLAVLAGVLVWKYTEDAKDDAKRPFTSVQVLVADKTIPINTSFTSALDNKQIVRKERVQRDLPAGYVSGESTDAALKSQFKALLASHNLAAGQTIVDSDFIAQGDVQSSLGGTLNTDQAKDKGKEIVAVTIAVDDTRAVGGFLQPGDSVNAVFTGSIGDSLDPGGPKVKTTTYFMPDLKLIAVGATTQTPAQQAAAASASGTATTAAAAGNRSQLTFEVTPRQSEQLIQMQQMGSVYLTLNPPSFKAGDFKDPGEIVEAINLFDKDLPLVKDTIAKLKAAGQ